MASLFNPRMRTVSKQLFWPKKFLSAPVEFERANVQVDSDIGGGSHNGVTSRENDAYKKAATPPVGIFIQRLLTHDILSLYVSAE